MLAAVVFYFTLFLTIVVLPALLILIFLLFIDHERRLWQRINPAVTPIAKRLWNHPAARRLRERYPRTVVFVARRLDPNDPWGLPATIAAAVILAGMWFFGGLIQDLVGKDPLVTLDVRLHNSVPLVRTPGMTWFMLALTEFGSPVVLWIIAIGSAALSLSRGKRRLAATFVLAIAGSGMLSSVLKAVVGHARPSDALIAAHEASFPSGHMLSGAVMYGLIAYLLLGSHVGRALRSFGTTLLLLLIVGIGLSRLYLGVHWPSDLLGSLALALICLALLLFFLHFERPLPRIDGVSIPISQSLLQAFGLAMFVVAIAVGALLMRYSKIVPVGPPAPGHPVARAALATTLPAYIPRRSEDLVGNLMEPVSLVFVGPQNQVIAAFERAGWTLADLPTPLRVMKEGFAALRNQPDPSGPATPAYLADRPQTLTFEKPDPSTHGIRRRHHTRVWQTQYCAIPGCQPVWVATASFDIGIELSARLHLPTHRIDPDIDAERALIVSDLTSAGAAELGVLRVVPALQGTNAAGDAFKTDGRAAVLAVPAG